LAGQDISPCSTIVNGGASLQQLHSFRPVEVVNNTDRNDVDRRELAQADYVFVQETFSYTHADETITTESSSYSSDHDFCNDPLWNCPPIDFTEEIETNLMNICNSLHAITSYEAQMQQTPTRTSRKRPTRAVRKRIVEDAESVETLPQNPNHGSERAVEFRPDDKFNYKVYAVQSF